MVESVSVQVVTAASGEPGASGAPGLFGTLVREYRVLIVEPGKEPLFLLLVGFILSFAFIRLSVRLIRHGVRWWPGNITPGGLHIHHMVFGIFFWLVAGIGSFTIPAAADGWRSLLGFLFGVGCGLVLDEFALILHLEDVYWSEQGRKSVDAVILGILLTGLLLVIGPPVGFYELGGSPLGVTAVLCANLVLVVVTLLKGKIWTGLLGIMLPPLCLVGAVRLALPSSPWARWRYTGRARRMARARRREARLHRRLDRLKQRFFDLIAGAPTPALPVPGRRAAARGEADGVPAPGPVTAAVLAAEEEERRAEPWTARLAARRATAAARRRAVRAGRRTARTVRVRRPRGSGPFRTR
ncbi:hypothetical protein [Allostreptomyces psammosilenae]|uniref:Integral membrane protein n=1 Tax=Allostreptomyces psammosilenae TaxID=1892865 RepID=A0A852ZTK7_9ACTN|nr:hypothetical protein [Allostreptomyces psammosilenae]NYI05669.1 hypothetical protein [Allostreptomyces psammosilenae]